jgi:hypothetical protein
MEQMGKIHFAPGQFGSVGNSSQLEMLDLGEKFLRPVR